MAFYINIKLPRVEEWALNRGFSGAAWGEDLLADVLFDGCLEVTTGMDKRGTGSRLWHLIGRRATLTCSLDDHRDDALFCIGVKDGPELGGRWGSGERFTVQGPWEIDDGGRRPPPRLPVVQHLDLCKQGHEHLKARGLLPEPKEGDGAHLSHNPFSVLRIQSFPTQAIVAAKKQATTVNRPAPAKPSEDAPGSKASPPDTASARARPEVQPSQDASTGVDAGIAPRPLQSASPTGPTRIADPPTPPSPPPVAPKAVEAVVPLHAGQSLERPGGAALRSGRPDPSPRIPTTGPLWADPAPRPTQHPARPLRSSPSSPSWETLATEYLVAEVPSAAGLLDAHDPQTALSARLTDIDERIADLRRLRASLPDSATLRTLERRQASFVAHGRKLLSHPPPGLADTGADLPQLLEALGGELPKSLPSWIAGVDLGAPEGPELLLLAGADAHVALLEAVAWAHARFGGPPPPGVRHLPPPTVPGPLAHQLDALWNTQRELEGRLQSLPERCRRWVRAVPPGAQLQAADALIRWESNLHATAFDELLDTLYEAGEGQHAALPTPALLLDLQPDGESILSHIASWQAASNFLRFHPSPRVSPIRSRPRQDGALERLGHVITDDRGVIIAPPIVVPRGQPGAHAIVVELPIRLTWSGDEPSQIEISWRSSALTLVPSSAPLPDGCALAGEGKARRLLWTIPHDPARWKAPSEGRVFREEILHFPLTHSFASKLRGGEDKLTLNYECGAVAGKLTFERFLADLPSLGEGTVTQSDATSSDLILNQALGAQVQHEKLERLVQEARQPFMVVAPRRFGKTTLLHHLAEGAATAGHEVVTVTLHRDQSPAQGLRHLWTTLRDTLNRNHKMAPDLGQDLPARLEAPEPWESLRRFVASKDKPALVLLVDEAQVLVPRAGGERWGNRFKDFFESVIGRPEPGLARVQIGLFGTVDLAVRIGQNCKDFLLMHGTEQHAFEEHSLARFLRVVSQDAILSSRSARSALVSWSTNLRTLYVVLEHLKLRLAQSQRIFVLDSDVESVVQTLLSPESTQSEAIWEYTRAELSHQDAWDPVDAFPLAVAWAREEVEDLAPAERLSACLDWLDQELEAIGPGGQIVPERVRASLQDLKVRGVLKSDGCFWRPLLAALLRRNANVLRQEEEGRAALMRMAVDAVELPQSLQLGQEGGQATVHRVVDGQRSWAYRICALEDESDRRRFARECAVMRTLREGRTRVPGDRHLPRITKAGFQADDPKQGIIVYAWIEGENLERRWEGLSGPLRVHLCHQLAEAVYALHTRDIIHCDIAPRNVVVNATWDVTLIDFGLARFTHGPSKTRLGGEVFKAPEQGGILPGSTKPSDIYALGMLLLGPNAGADLPGVTAQIAREMTQADPKLRPSIEAVQAHLQGSSSLNLALHRSRELLEALVQQGPPYLAEELSSHALKVALGLQGHLPLEQELLLETAHTLNTLFMRILTHSRGRDARRLRDLSLDPDRSLSKVYTHIQQENLARDLPQWVRVEVGAVGLLRNAWAHPNDRLRLVKKARVLLKAPPGEALKTFAQALASVATLLDGLLDGDARVIEPFLGYLLPQPPPSPSLPLNHRLPGVHARPQDVLDAVGDAAQVDGVNVP